MTSSAKHKFIFIANPKTGTTYIQNILKCNIEDSLQNTILTNEKVFNFGEHVPPSIVRKDMAEFYNIYKKVVFIRHPYDKVVSSYFFLKNGNPLTKGNIWAYRLKLKTLIRAIVTYLNTITARTIPFEIWSILRPTKRNSKYVLDGNQFVVNYIGRTEYLEPHFHSIFSEIGITLKVKNEIGQFSKNKSAHNEPSSYFKEGSMHKKIFDFIYRKELELYCIVASKPPTFDFYGKSLDQSLRSIE
ncbi:MAG: sulfotransferase family 2 domain-containing protein [Phaeodactylibacter sp.]|uniref:sulfotransferase family 2 domain-containing protein n=1 Tax=Phaeodactylibacter sp. TaxID=1940289 RepID=UPI0032F01D1D